MSRAARRWAVALAATAVLTAGLVGCGEEETPAQQVPALADALAEVDAAAAADDDARLREAVADLVAVAEDAEQSGDLDAGDADRIVTAAEALLDVAAPASGPEPESETTDTSTPSPPDTDKGPGKGDKKGPKDEKNEPDGDDDEDEDD